MAGAPAPAPAPTPSPPTIGPGGDFTGIDLTPYLSLFLVAWGALEIAGILPDPISLLLSFFAGRPREQATVEIANRLLASPNPSAKILGIEWLKALHDFGLVVSDSGSADVIINALNKQFTDGLVAQGVSLGRARNILVNAYSRAAQDGAPLEPELKQSLQQGLSLYGPSSFQTLSQKYTTQGENLGYQGDKLNRFVLRQILIHQPVDQLDKITIGPTDQGTQGGGGGNGGGGNGGGGNGGGGQGGNGEGDELTDCCQASAAALQAIATALNNLIGSFPGGTDTGCCANVVEAINGVASALGAVGSSGGGGGTGETVDLSSVVAQLTAIALNIASIPGPPSIDFTPVVDALNTLGQTLSNAITGNQADLRKWMETLPPHTARAQAMFQRVGQLGFIEGDLLQLISQ